MISRHLWLPLLMFAGLFVTFPTQASPLHEAAEKGDLKRVERLIAKGADVNARDKSDLTPLHLVAIFGHTAVAQFLIVKGANVNSETGSGVAPPTQEYFQYLSFGHRQYF